MLASSQQGSFPDTAKYGDHCLRLSERQFLPKTLSLFFTIPEYINYVIIILILQNVEHIDHDQETGSPA